MYVYIYVFIQLAKSIAKSASAVGSCLHIASKPPRRAVKKPNPKRKPRNHKSILQMRSPNAIAEFGTGSMAGEANLQSSEAKCLTPCRASYRSPAKPGLTVSKVGTSIQY